MPTYEYQCTDSQCGHRFELFQSIKASTTRKCPECGNTAKRLISAGAGIIFKGSGFYVTDYRSKDYEDRAKADAAPTSDTGSKSDSKSSSDSKDKSSSGSDSSKD